MVLRCCLEITALSVISYCPAQSFPSLFVFPSRLIGLFCAVGVGRVELVLFCLLILSFCQSSCKLSILTRHCPPRPGVVWHGGWTGDRDGLPRPHAGAHPSARVRRHCVHVLELPQLPGGGPQRERHGLRRLPPAQRYRSAAAPGLRSSTSAVNSGRHVAQEVEQVSW